MIATASLPGIVHGVVVHIAINNLFKLESNLLLRSFSSNLRRTASDNLVIFKET